jgi:hypothetical protein
VRKGHNWLLGLLTLTVWPFLFVVSLVPFVLWLVGVQF